MAIGRAAVVSLLGRCGRAVARLRWQLELRRLDVVFVSYPKAGRTWLRAMVGRALALHAGVADRATEEDIVLVSPLVKYSRSIPRVAFTHDGSPQGATPAEIEADDKRRYRRLRVVLLVRDPRDVVVSLYFQKSRRRMGEVAFPKTIEEFVHGSRGGIDSVIAYHRNWARRSGVPKDLLVVRYEDLHEAPERELRRVLDFMGMVDVSGEVVAAAVDSARFERMRALEQSGTFTAEELQPGDRADPESYKTRRGRIGTYPEYLGPEDVDVVDAKVADSGGIFGYRA